MSPGRAGSLRSGTFGPPRSPPSSVEVSGNACSADIVSRSRECDHSSQYVFDWLSYVSVLPSKLHRRGHPRQSQRAFAWHVPRPIEPRRHRLAYLCFCFVEPAPRARTLRQSQRTFARHVPATNLLTSDNAHPGCRRSKRAEETPKCRPPTTVPLPGSLTRRDGGAVPFLCAESSRPRSCPRPPRKRARRSHKIEASQNRKNTKIARGRGAGCS